MRLGVKIRQLREEVGLTQGQLASFSTVSQGYLSQLENGEVKNPSASVLLRIAQAMNLDADDLFEAAGYPTVRKLRHTYNEQEKAINPELLKLVSRLPRDRQRRLLEQLLEMVRTLQFEESFTPTATG